MEREVTVDNQKYKIRIGFGAYNRIDALSVFVRATNPTNTMTVEAKPNEQISQEEKEASTKDGIKVSTNVLVSEDVMTPNEAKIINDITFGQMKLVDLLEIEKTLGEKVSEAKLSIIAIAVRDTNGRPLSTDFLESNLSPSSGEKLFTLVMETFELLKQQMENPENIKN